MTDSEGLDVQYEPWIAVLWFDPSASPSGLVLIGLADGPRCQLWQTTLAETGPVNLLPSVQRLHTPLPPWITTDSGAVVLCQRAEISHEGRRGLFWAGYCAAERRWYVSANIIWTTLLD